MGLRCRLGIQRGGEGAPVSQRPSPTSSAVTGSAGGEGSDQHPQQTKRPRKAHILVFPPGVWPQSSCSWIFPRARHKRDNILSLECHTHQKRQQQLFTTCCAIAGQIQGSSHGHVQTPLGCMCRKGMRAYSTMSWPTTLRSCCLLCTCPLSATTASCTASCSEACRALSSSACGTKVEATCDEQLLPHI